MIDGKGPVMVAGVTGWESAGSILPVSITEWGERLSRTPFHSTLALQGSAQFGFVQHAGIVTHAVPFPSGPFHPLAPRLALSPPRLPTAPPPSGHLAPLLPPLAPLAAPALRGVPGTRDARVLRVPDSGLQGRVLPVVLGRHAAAMPGLHTPRGALLLRLQRQQR